MTKKQIENYINNYILHSIQMTEVGNAWSSEISSLVKKYVKKCSEVIQANEHCYTKKSCKQLKTEIAAIMTELRKELAELLTEYTDNAVINEKQWLKDNVEEVLKLDFKYKLVFDDLIYHIPIATIGAVDDYSASVTDRLNKICNEVIMAGYVTSSLLSDVMQDYEARLTSLERNVEKEALTLGESISNQYDRIVYTNNKVSKVYYVWVSMLDTNTCLACADLSAQRFDDITKAPPYPYHQNCRCMLIPCTEEIEENIPQSYSEWFENQNTDTKKQILGKSRFQLYENGMKIKNFVNNGRISPLKDLKK